MGDRERVRGNPWGTAGGKPAGKTVNRVSKRPELSSSEKKFAEAQVKLRAAVEKHSANYDSSSEEEELESDSILGSVLRGYTQLGGSASDLDRTQTFLENAFHSNAATCLICIGSVKRADPIWSCEGCFCYFHINCIQRWAKDSLFQQKSALEEFPNSSPSKKSVICWSCPKCRKDYLPEDSPQRYECFCGATINPPEHPWLVPHSCGETCNRPLQPDCGHKCLLLCHPGPCPPCPKTITASCLCGQAPNKTVRCSVRTWKCLQNCSQLLPCGAHICSRPCHAPPCMPCPETSIQACVCGNERELRKCEEKEWHCEKVCNKPLSCGRDVCAVVCHRGPCPPCPSSLPRSCPCGKQLVQLPCSEDVIPCGDTCNKQLRCGEHYCQERCHRGNCSNCLAVVTKSCNCGSYNKELPCYKDFTCDSKCKAMRDCNKHACNRKCCDGQCPPCDKPCGRTLKCGKHKCASQCHRGPCYPCGQQATVSCRCQATTMRVPCGREKKTKLLKCLRPCKIPPTCAHPFRVLHNCHRGMCPPCTLPCTSVQQCGHVCNAPCHSAVLVTVNNDRPVGPWDVNKHVEVKSLPCPPCNVRVPWPCLGGHETPLGLCHEALRGLRSCGRACGKLLPCGNHKCQKECHKTVDEKGGMTCEPCGLPCQFPRAVGCTHPCSRPCHTSACAPCSTSIKQVCHCGLTQLYIKCYQLNGNDVTQETRDSLLSCGNQCSKLYPCGHRCKDDCHPGECTSAEICQKKTKVFCPCKRIKRDFPCDKVRQNECSVACDDTCKRKQEQEETILKEQAIQRKKNEEERNKKEVEMFEKKFGKKKHRKRSFEDDVVIEQSTWLKVMMVFAILSGAFCAVYYGHRYYSL